MRTRIVLSLLAAVLLAMASLTATPTPAQAQSSTEAVFDKGAFLLGNLEKGGATTPGGTVWAFANSFKTPKDDDRIERLRSLHLAGGYGSGHTVSIHADSSGLPRDQPDDSPLRRRREQRRRHRPPMSFARAGTA